MLANEVHLFISVLYLHLCALTMILIPVYFECNLFIRLAKSRSQSLPHSEAFSLLIKHCIGPLVLTREAALWHPWQVRRGSVQQGL